MKVKSVLFFLLIYTFQSSFSKGSFDYVFSNHNWKYGLSVSPALHFGSISGLSTKGNLDYKPFVGFSTGVLFSKRVAKTTFFEVGLQYSLAGIKYNREPTENFELEFTANKERVTDRFEQLTIPIKGIFYMSDFRLRKYMSVGASLNTQLRQTKYQTLYLPEDAITTNVINNKGSYSRLGASFFLGFGAEYDIEQDLSFAVEPYFGVSLFPGKESGYAFMGGLNIKIQLQGN